MKTFFFFLTVVLIAINISFAQYREIARGATNGELYISDYWYTVYKYQLYTDTIHKAIFRITENGKKIAIQHSADVWNGCDTLMCQQNYIVADATPGVLYNVRDYDGIVRSTMLWISFDYGKNWTLKENNFGQLFYFAANVEGLIFRTGSNWWDGTFRSNDYGTNFTMVDSISICAEEPGLDTCEFFTYTPNYPFTQYELWHTYDVYQTKTIIPIDNQFAKGDFRIVCRGSLKNEVYIGSLFYSDKKYRVSFSADTGHTFRHVYESDDVYSSYSDYYPIFMTDREPGVFYIIKRFSVLEYNLRHLKICVEHYKDYGETLVATYCHDLHKNYGKTCEPVTDLVAEICSNNSVSLSWSEPESSLPVIEYYVYRSAESRKQKAESKMEWMLVEVTTNTTFFDENLPVGSYEYFVVTHYEMGCVSDSSNHVAERVELGVKGVTEVKGVTVYPNPTTGELRIENGELRTAAPVGASSAKLINNVEIYDVYGRKQLSIINCQLSIDKIDISHLQPGIYFVRVVFEGGSSVKKLVKL